MTQPEVLILASRFDVTCDLVVAQLRKRGTAYLRLNSEDLPSYQLTLDPLAATCTGVSDALTFELTAERLVSIYFRQPVFLRESATAIRPPEEQLARVHWATFLRSFMIFDACTWINHPVATYRAEHKAVQLAAAATLGFDLPATIFTNSTARAAEIAHDRHRVALKGIDTVLVRDGGDELFGYTELVELASLSDETLAAIPVTLQESIDPKIDLRVTVLDDHAWCASVTDGSQGITGDWRRLKHGAEFTPFQPPAVVLDRCCALVRHLGLRFGAIDLVIANERYYFLEINPTGEWAWLESAAGFAIAPAIADALVRG